MATAKNQNDASKPVKIALNLIKADHALQPRVEMDDEHWNRMARAYVEGEDAPPPVDLFFDGKFYWLADGFHRYKAMWSLRHMGAKFQHIRAFVHDGARDDAIVFAAQANLNNRSKPMSDADRKKAMWMLLDLPEWRSKSGTAVGKLFGLSQVTGRKYWMEYFPAHGLPVPDTFVNARGRTQTAFKRTKKNPKLPSISKAKGYGFQSVFNGKTYSLGNDLEKAREILSGIVRNAEIKTSNYENGAFMVETLAANSIRVDQVYGAGTEGAWGLYARLAGGIAVTWESFRNKNQAPAAYGRACHARDKTGATRAVVLCPVEKVPAEVIEDFRRMGVEWMRMEEFVAGLRADRPGDPA